MIDGDFLIRWTVRLALLCYVAAWAIVLGSRSRTHDRSQLIFWTLGCIFFLGHVAAAMHFYHHWSHAHAFADTAEQTQSQLGWSFGYGIYFSYVFTLLWLCDVIWAWVQSNRSSPWRWLVHGYMFFIAVNGAIVFHAGPTRWLGLLACAALGGLALWRWRRGGSTAGQVQLHPDTSP